MTITGESLRDAGQAAVIAADEMEANAGEYITAQIREFIDEGREFSADDIREALDGYRPIRRAMAIHPNLLPAIMAGFSKKKAIVPVGVCRPSRASRRTNWNMVWKAAPPTRA